MTLSEFLSKINKTYTRPDNYDEIEKELSEYCKKEFGLDYDYAEFYDKVKRNIKWYPKVYDINKLCETEGIRKTDTREFEWIPCYDCRGKGGEMSTWEYPSGINGPRKFLHKGPYNIKFKYQHMAYDCCEICKECGGSGKIKNFKDKR